MRTITVTTTPGVEYDPIKDFNRGVINHSFRGEKESIVVSDGYHTMDELYQHRYELFIALCKAVAGINEIGDHYEIPSEMRIPVWRSKLHSDGTMFSDSFIMGLFTEHGDQISYHLPMHLWERTEFAQTLDKAPEWDKHTSQDVLARLGEL